MMMFSSPLIKQSSFRPRPESSLPLSSLLFVMRAIGEFFVVEANYFCSIASVSWIPASAGMTEESLYSEKESR